MLRALMGKKTLGASFNGEVTGLLCCERNWLIPSIDLLVTRWFASGDIGTANLGNVSISKLGLFFYYYNLEILVIGLIFDETPWSFSL